MHVQARAPISYPPGTCGSTFFFLPSFPAQPHEAEALDDKLKPDSIINDDDDDDHGGGNDENDVTLDTDDDGVMIWRREGRKRRDRCSAN